MYKIFANIVIVALFLIIYVKYLENHGIYYPAKNIEVTPELINLSFQDLYVKTKDNLLINAWLILKDNAKYTILFCHGNAGNIQDRLDKIEFFHRLGINVCIFDYRGFGKSQGRPSEQGLYVDTKAVYDYLVNNRKIKPEVIILYGESLGTAVAINLAQEVKIKALIMEGAFSRGRDMARKIYPFLPAFLFSNTFDSLSKIKVIDAPKLFIHSKDDEIVPFALAQKLYQTACEPKKFIAITGGHNTSFLDSQEEYASSITAFINNLK